MLKWFRLYNKIILVVGGCLLMVAFLIQPVLSMFMPSPKGQILGTLGDREITLGDQQIAGRDLGVIRQASPILGMFTPEEPLQWILMQHEASQLGIEASDYELTELIHNLGLTNTILSQVAKSFLMTGPQVRQTLKRWLVVQHYKELIQGASHEPVVQKLRALGDLQLQLSQILPQAQGFMRQYYMGMFYQRLAQAMAGQPRLSRPLLEHFVSDQQMSVKVALVPISSDRYLDQVSEPTEEQLVDLFQKYKQDLPGSTKPYGFGYRMADRVQIEYLSLPADRIDSLVSASEADAINYYDAHQDEFTEQLPPQAPAPEGEAAAKPATVVKAYADVRDQILDRLKKEAVRKHGDQIIKTAQNLLLADARRLATRKGYRVLPKNFKPTSLETVAVAIQKQFGVLPSVVVDDQHWLTLEQLRAVPGLGTAGVLGKSRVQFADYAISVREIERKTPHPQAALRLQTGLVSLPLGSFDGSRYLFRIRKAQGTRVPKSISEVRDQVVADARRLSAFDLALQDRDAWVKRLGTDSLQVIAKELGVTIHSPAPFQRRRFMFGGAEVPTIEPVGQDEQFVDGVFELADKVSGDDASKLAILPVDKRSGVVSSPSNLTTYLVRVDDVRPLTQAQFTNMASQPGIGASLMPQGSNASDDGLANAFSMEALSRRLGYKSAFDDDDKTN